MSVKWKRVAKTAGLVEEKLEDFSDLDEVEPELFIKFLRIPSLKNYSSLKIKLERCDEKWITGFLRLGGMTALFEVLEKLGERVLIKFTDAFVQLECVRCIKAVLNRKTGLEFMVQSQDFTRQLATGKSFISSSKTLPTVNS
jgi:hypothetical protein